MLDIVIWIIAAYAVYYVILIFIDILRSGRSDNDEEDSEIIDVTDMVSGTIKPKQMELSAEVKKKYLQAGESDESKRQSQQKQDRVFGSVFAQGYEVDSYDKEGVMSGGSTFDRIILSV